MRGSPFVLLLLLAPALAAQQPPSAPPTHEQGAPAGQPMGTMMARMDSLDLRLDSLRGAMRRASGNRKLEAMERLLDALVTRHLDMQREMRERMRDPEMMRRMMHGHDGPPPDSATAGHDHNH